MIRTVWTFAVIAVATLIIGPVTIAGGLLGVRKLEFYDWCGRAWSGMILWGSGCPVRAEGVENIDPDTPQVLVGNHQSWFDVPAVATNIPKSYHFVAKKELERVFIFGRAWKAAGHISIDRTDRESAIRSLDQAGEQLRRERSAVVIFAEGTRAPTDELQKFKKGAFMLALHTGVPIVPFAVAGSRRVLPKGRWRVRRGPIIVRFGEPIPTANLTEAERDSLLERVRGEVRRLRDEGRAELPPGRLEQPHEPIH
ncbi:MAG: lysophospholipid acyltransferase family protein [Longimicrobiales bacterium]|nr:lysophospholipid acyltransferase family protein [Longimicrobiales bacterium]